jgi:SAM-dependent methyltransferase
MSRAAFVHLIRLAVLGQFPSVDNGGYDAVAEISIDWMENKGIPLGGRIVLDLGGGTGIQALRLAKAGAKVIVADLGSFPVSQEYHRICCDARNLGLGQSSMDIVYCSNLLEHIPPSSHSRLFTEMWRVLRPGGYVYLSWSNWLSPFGGHEHSPFHCLGSIGIDLSCRLRRLRGRFVKHRLGVNLFRTHIGSVIQEIVLSHPGLRIVDIVPRYWPWLGSICRVPWVREFLTWNCVILLRKSDVGV